MFELLFSLLIIKIEQSTKKICKIIKKMEINDSKNISPTN